MPASVTILSPALNEEAVIERFIDNARDHLEHDWELLIVDDGSTDRTPEILTKGVETEPRLRVVTHESNRGLGAALVSGFQNATGDVIVTMDADLSHPFELLPALIKGCETSDAVYGSRYVKGGGMEGVPLMRVLVSRIANMILRIVFATSVTDLTTGLRAYRREAIRDLDVSGTGFETQLEITVRLIAAGRSISEVPLLLKERFAGESKMRYLRLIRRYSRMALRLIGVRYFRR